MTEAATLITKDELFALMAPTSSLKGSGSIDICIEAASSWVVGELGVPVLEAVFTEHPTSDNEILLGLKAYPVTAISSLTYQGAPLLWFSDDITGSTGAYNTYDIWVYSKWGILMSKNNLFSRWPGDFLITYTAGYKCSVVPRDLKMATAIVAHLLAIEPNRVGVGAKTMGPEQISMIVRNAKEYTTMVTDAIAHNRRKVL